MFVKLMCLGPAISDRFACTHRYPSDDINKFLWMVRIGGGVFPDIKEPDYLGERGYTIDDKAGKVQLMCIETDFPYVWEVTCGF